MKRQSLDIYDDIPFGMKSYIRHMGWHFNKKALDYAVSVMRGKGDAKIEPWTKEQVDAMLTKYGIKLSNDVLYDSTYVANKIKADNWGSSISDEQHAALHIKDTIDDPDAGDGEVFAMWYAAMVRRGIPIDWDEIL